MLIIDIYIYTHTDIYTHTVIWIYNTHTHTHTHIYIYTCSMMISDNNILWDPNPSDTTRGPGNIPGDHPSWIQLWRCDSSAAAAGTGRDLRTTSAAEQSSPSQDPMAFFAGSGTRGWLEKDWVREPGVHVGSVHSNKISRGFDVKSDTVTWSIHSIHSKKHIIWRLCRVARANKEKLSSCLTHSIFIPGMTSSGIGQGSSSPSLMNCGCMPCPGREYIPMTLAQNLQTAFPS